VVPTYADVSFVKNAHFNIFVYIYIYIYFPMILGRYPLGITKQNIYI